MNKIETLFLEVIKGTFHESDLEKVPDEFVNEILRLADRHSLLPMVYMEVGKKTDYRLIDEFYKKKAVISSMNQKNRTDKFLSLYDKFVQNGLYPVVVKGIVCRDMYGKYSNHRVSGDEDIYVSSEEFKRVQEILNENGYFCIDRIKEDINDLQEISFVNKENSLVIEVHINLIGKHNDFHSELNECFKDSLNKKKEIQLETSGNIKIWSLSYTEHYLFLIIHAFKHFGNKGLGIRQILDIMLFEEKFDKQIDFKYITDMLVSCKVYSFWKDIELIGSKYLGFALPKCLESRGENIEDLLEDIILNGVFGQDSQAQRTALSMVNAAIVSKKDNFFLILRNTLFPDHKQMEAIYPELREKEYNIFIQWTIRWINLFNHRKENHKLIQESLKISKRRIKLLRKYDVI